MTAPKRRPTRALRARGGAIAPEYRRGYVHALDDLCRWMEHGGEPPTLPDADARPGSPA